jgi:hypothetical protein
MLADMQLHNNYLYSYQMLVMVVTWLQNYYLYLYQIVVTHTRVMLGCTHMLMVSHALQLTFYGLLHLFSRLLHALGKSLYTVKLYQILVEYSLPCSS